MSKVRVQLWGKPQGYATVDPSATEGATLGVNLFWPNGTLVVPDDLAPTGNSGGDSGGDDSGGDGQPSSAPSLWELIVNVPENVQAVAGLSTAGFVRRDGAGAWSASPIVNADLSGANTSGLAEGTNLYYTNARADARVAAGIASHEAAADPHPQYLTQPEGDAAYAPLAHVGAGSTAHAAATTSVAGFMSAADKAKLDGITSGATAYTDENAQDAVGAAIAAGTGDGVSLAYDDAGNKINATNTDKGSVAVASHVAAPDPHPQYTTEAEASAAAVAVLAAHLADPQPHPNATFDGGNF